MKHLVDAVPWIIALLVSLGFSRVLFEGWADLNECIRSWLRSIVRKFFYGHRFQNQAELRDSTEHFKLALLLGVGLIAGLISRALLMGAGLMSP